MELQSLVMSASLSFRNIPRILNNCLTVITKRMKIWMERKKMMMKKTITEKMRKIRVADLTLTRGVADGLW